MTRIFTGRPLRARHRSRCWGLFCERNSSPSAHGAAILAGHASRPAGPKADLGLLIQVRTFRQLSATKGGDGTKPSPTEAGAHGPPWGETTWGPGPWKSTGLRPEWQSRTNWQCALWAECPPPRFPGRSPHPSVTVWRTEGMRVKWGSRGGAWSYRISVLSSDTGALTLPSTWGHKEKRPPAGQDESLHRELNWLAPWSWTSQPQGLRENKFCHLSHSVYGILWQG